MLVYLSEDEVLTDLTNKEVLFWELNHITYGSWDEGPSRDSTWALSKQLYTSDVSLTVCLRPMCVCSQPMCVCLRPTCVYS